MNRTFITEPIVNSIPLADTRAGDIVIVTEGANTGKVILVANNATYIALEDPSVPLDSWGVRVRKLPKGTKVEFTVGVALSANDERLVRELYQAGRKIEAIKHVRTVTLLGLREAKELADDIGSR